MGILLLGACLRLWGIGHSSLNDDEFWGVAESKPGVRYILLEQWKKDIHPPLNLLLLHSWMKFRDSDGWLRLPSAIFSVATVGVLMLLAWEISSSWAISLVAGFFFSLSPFALHFAQYAKGYALLGLLSTSSCLFFLRSLRRSSRGDLFGLTLINLLGAYLHYSMLLLILAENMAFLLFRKQVCLSMKRWLCHQVATAILYLPWLPIFLHQWLAGRDYAIGDVLKALPGSLKGAYLFYCFSLGVSVGPFNLWAVLPAAMAFGITFLLGLKSCFQGGKNQQLLGILFLIPLLGGLARAAMVPKHFYLLLPLYLLVITLGLVRSSQRRTKGVFVLAGAIVIASAFASFNFLTGHELHAPATPWKEVALQIQKTSLPDSRILLYPEKRAGTYRYSRMLARYLPRLEAVLIPIGLEDTEEEILRLIEALPQGPLWAVLHYGGSDETERRRERIKAYLDERYRLMGSWNFGKNEHILGGGTKATPLRRQAYYALELRKYQIP